MRTFFVSIPHILKVIVHYNLRKHYFCMIN